MIVIGLTGALGAGKSTVARMLADLGAAVIDADAVGHELIEPGFPAWRELVDAFGPGILLEDGHINRRALARLAFAGPAAVDKLNRATHPHIIREIAGRLQRLRDAGCEVAVVEAALLLETDLRLLVTTVWTVDASEQVRLERLSHSEGLTVEDARARMAAQLPAAEKARLADVVIDNSGSQVELLSRVGAAWRRLQGESA